MSLLTQKDIFNILSEASAIDDVELDYVEDTDDIDEIIMSDDLTDEFDTFDESLICYNEEMIPVLQFSNNQYIIESDNLLKYMKTNNLNVKTSMINICEYNKIPFENTFLLIESDETLYQSLEEAKSALKSKDKGVREKAKEKLKNAKKEIKALKDKGVKVLKKK